MCQQIFQTIQKNSNLFKNFLVNKKAPFKGIGKMRCHSLPIYIPLLFQFKAFSHKLCKARSRKGIFLLLFDVFYDKNFLKAKKIFCRMSLKCFHAANPGRSKSVVMSRIIWGLVRIEVHKTTKLRSWSHVTNNDTRQPC